MTHETLNRAIEPDIFLEQSSRLKSFNGTH